MPAPTLKRGECATAFGKMPADSSGGAAYHQTMKLNKFLSLRQAALALVASAGLWSCAQAAEPAKVCVFDPIGTSGDVHRALEDYRLQMAKAGYSLVVRTYVDENVAVEDFRTNQCDALMATGIRTRHFVPVSAALDSPGASSILRNGRIDMDASFDVVRKFIGILSSPKAASMVKVNQYEVAGIIPLGAAYAFVNDKQLKTLQAAAGKRVAALDHDRSQAELIMRAGARPVAANITNFATMFNNGSVDVIIAPAIIYRPFELQKGIGTKGGVARFPITILSYQMIIRSSAFPEGFGQVSRSHFAKNVEEAIRIARKADLDIPPKLWLDPTQEENDQYMVLMRQGRVLMANKGLFDKTGLKILKRIRCSVEPASAECSERTEEWK